MNIEKITSQKRDNMVKYEDFLFFSSKIVVENDTNAERELALRNCILIQRF